MKRTPALLTVISIIMLLPFQFLLAQNEVISLSEPVMITDQYDIYGSEMEEYYELTNLSILHSEGFEPVIGEEFHFEGILAEVCQTRGCNFYLDSGESQIRVRFLDYSFFIPTDSGGRQTVVRGSLVQKEDEETGEPFLELLSSAIKIYKPE